MQYCHYTLVHHHDLIQVTIVVIINQHLLPFWASATFATVDLGRDLDDYLIWVDSPKIPLHPLAVLTMTTTLPWVHVPSSQLIRCSLQ